MSLNLKKWIGGLAVLGVCLVSVLATSAKDAPKPTAPPTVWLKYVHEKIKAPKPAPKENQAESRPKLPGVSSLSGSSVPMAKDAPPPTAPPTVWLKYVHEKIKAPKPAPKENQTESRPKLPGVSSLSGALPSATTFPPKRPPYVHPRDLKDFTGDIHKQIQGPPPPR